MIKQREWKKRVHVPSDDLRFIRNPAMGWMLYVDCFEQPFPIATTYWGLQRENVKWASILYIRVPWSQLEPEEGKYAWLYDENYKQLISMARQYQLKLAFRVYIDSKDAYRQATPPFVFNAGAEGYINEWKDEPFRTPYVNDRIFQTKFATFIAAFAREYDDSDIVDFVDGQGLGWWGEMHNVDYLTGKEKSAVFQWITSLYSEHFQHVLLGLQFGKGSFAYHLQQQALQEKGYMIRRDSFGSPQWLQAADKEKISEQWPTIPVFAENCYHTFNERPDWYEADGFSTLTSMLERVVADALEMHANALDLRIPQDATMWMQQAPHLVEQFAISCGYRYSPVELEYSIVNSEANRILQVEHRWQNTAVGKLPNNLRNWHNKYKLAFALLDKETMKVVNYYIEEAVELAEWLHGLTEQYKTTWTVQHIMNGSYMLAAGILNIFEEAIPAIELAIPLENKYKKWWIIDEIIME